MNKLARTLLVGVLAVAGGMQMSCNVNDYCLNCGTGDAHGSGSNDGAMDGNGDDGGDDGGGPCVPTGPEICDGKDNDCNGLKDDGVLPGVGDLCANQMGECAGGVQQCTNGALTCTKKPSPETCDSKDNDCNGLTDEGDPGGGSKCGTDMGECTAGANHCVGGAIVCTGTIGGTMAPFGTPETCNAKDDDCDGIFDEGLTNMGACGFSSVGLCTMGVLTCVGGAPQCDTDAAMAGIQSPVFPAFEACDTFDNDCDGLTDEGYDLLHDPQNCGVCNAVCGSNLANGGNANWGCAPTGPTTAACTITSCKAGYHDNNIDPTDGCEFGVCFSTGVEVCDGEDNDCDGMTDEGIATPVGLCNPLGECAGTMPTCEHVDGWKCEYPGSVSTLFDTMPAMDPYHSTIVAETKCDTLDNDCNGTIDDHQPQMAHNDGTALTPVSCDDGEQGVCKKTGKYQCDATNLFGPAVCGMLVGGGPGAMTAEKCNNLDDDCDGIIDNGGATGNLIGQSWVNIGGGHCSTTVATGCLKDTDCPGIETCVGSRQMMQFEASKPDATAANTGSVTGIACSQAGVQPWINVKYPEAVAACASIGARLCTSQEWHHTCSVVAAPRFPIGIVTTGTYIEAEDYSNIAFATDANAETGAQCNNAVDDDGDGAINDGCPVVGAAETGNNCLNNTDDDGDGKVNDGCPTVGTARSWIEDYTTDGAGTPVAYSGISDMATSPNAGVVVALANAGTQSPRLDYSVNIATASATYHLYVKMFSATSNDNTAHVGINTTSPAAATVTVTTTQNNRWQWIDAGAFNLTTGAKTISVYMGSDGVKVDALYLINNTTAAFPAVAPHGNKWAYQTAPNAYNMTTCNGQDFSAANDDVLTAGFLGGGALTTCSASLSAGVAALQVFDMSGNVKEWTKAQQPGQNPMRGGASNNTADGISCPLNFTLADDTFAFPNVGFRCCR